jgi:mannosyltransferase
LLIALLVIASGLRFYHLEYQSLWVDEIATMNGSDPDRTWALVVEYCRYDQPPAYFFAMHAWFKAFPFNDFFGRMPAALLGLAGIIAMYFFGKEVKDSRTGLIAAIITTFSYIHILFSQEARFYTLLFLGTALSYLFFIRSVKFKAILDFVLYGIFTSIVLYTHYFGLVVFATQGLLFCFLLILYPRSSRFILLSIITGIAVAISIIPWIPVFFSDIQIKEFWIQMEPFYFPLKYFYVYFKDVVSCLAFGSALIFYGFKTYRQYSTSRSISQVDFILIGGVLFSMLIPLIYSLVRTPMLQVRYTLILLPALIIMISIGIGYLAGRYQWVLVAVTSCTSIFSLLVVEEYYSRVRKEDWRGIVARVIDEGKPGELVISSQPWYCNYYFKVKGSATRAFTIDDYKSGIAAPGIWWLDAFQVETVPADVANRLEVDGFESKKTYKHYRANVIYYERRSPVQP